jgi:hypothetical protein
VFADDIPDTISLTNGKLLIRDDLIIDGTAADLLTVSGNNETNIVFEISIDATVAIEGLTIADARQTSGDLFGYEDYRAGGILNFGTLTVSNSTIRSNSVFFGGGIYNDGSLTVNNSTVINNNADYGGGISNKGSLTVNNSTVSNNIGYINGGGIYNNGNVTVNNSTITGNKQGQFEDEIITSNIVNNGTLVVNNSTTS